MAMHTPIEWCDSAVNPVMGCDGCELWVPSQDIKLCYAGALHHIRGGNPGYAERFEEPKLFPGRMAKAARWSDLTGTARPDKPWLDGRPRHIFISDMGDALSRDVPFEYLRDEIVVVVASPLGRRHIWMWLTKQPGRMAEFSRWLAAQGIAWPANLWAMTSVTSRKTLGRVAQLLQVEGAKVRGLSVEPLLEAVSLWRFDDEERAWRGPGVVRSGGMTVSTPNEPSEGYDDSYVGVDFVIVGGESGPGARPFDVAWARSIVSQCREAQVPAFVKQLGAHVIWNGFAGPDEHWPRSTGTFDTGLGHFRKHLRDKKGSDMTEWPADLRVREFPR